LSAYGAGVTDMLFERGIFYPRIAQMARMIF